MRTKPWGRKTRQITDITSTALEKKKCCYACRLFGMDILKEGAMWHVDLLIGSGCKTNS
jgi:hypothetical protein